MKGGVVLSMYRLLLLVMAILMVNIDNIYANYLDESGYLVENNEYQLQWGSDSDMGEYEIWTDGATVLTDYIDGKLFVTVDALTNSEQDYYTAYIYKTGNFDWSEYGELVFDLSNMSEEPLRLNFILTDANHVDYIINETMPILAMSEDSDIMELIPNQWGSSEVPAGFKGIVRVPDYHISNLTLANIISFGISATVPKNTSQSFSISNVKLVQLKLSSAIYGFDIYGDTEIQIPPIGETISFYTVVFDDTYESGKNNMNINESIVFRLDREVEGVAITPDGKLTVKEQAGNYNFKIYADIDERVRRILPVELFERNEGGLQLPRQNELGVLKTDDNIFFNMGILHTTRYVCFTVAVSLCALFFWWRAWWLKIGVKRDEDSIY